MVSRICQDPKNRDGCDYALAVLNAGAPAPGMNTAVRAVVRWRLDKCHQMFGVYNGFQGLRNGEIQEFDWISVNSWALLGGSELGTNRMTPADGDFYAIARNIEDHGIDGLLVIGGWSGYEFTPSAASPTSLMKKSSAPLTNGGWTCAP